ncbi:MAG: aspartyl/asparaginyl beta-hydroxylase domain-containing protein, partial [Planctomycetota bacterium]
MFIDVDANFPALRALASNFEAIRDEALAIDPADYFEYIQREIFTGSWRLFVLYSEVEDWTYANAVEENRRRCPRTWELVKDVPDKVLVGFSYLAPQTHVYPH